MKKIIPCLDMKGGRVVKGVNFEGLTDMGDPLELAKKYNEEGADELVFLDIARTEEGHDLLLESIQTISEVIDIPLTVGGGVQHLSDIQSILDVGASHVSISSKAVKDPEFIREASDKFGSDAITVAIDAAYDELEDDYYIYTQGGKKREDILLADWIEEMAAKGAGRFLITSIDKDGVQDGFDLELYKTASKHTKLPIIASGGAGSIQDFVVLFQETDVESGLAASIFHKDVVGIPELKETLVSEGIDVYEY